MNRNFIFAFILLAMLSMGYAIPLELHKRTPECLSGSEIDATYSPNPIVFGGVYSTAYFTINGTLSSDASADCVLNVDFYDNNGKQFISGGYGFGPVPAGVNFKYSLDFELDDVDYLPGEFEIEFAIYDL